MVLHQPMYKVGIGTYNMKNKKNFLIASGIVVLIVITIFSFINKSTDAKTNEAPIIAYDNMKFVFVGHNQNFDESELEKVGKVQVETKELPINNYEGTNIQVGTEIFKLKSSSLNKDAYSYIFIKNKNNNSYEIGFPYFKDETEKEKVTQYMEKKSEEYDKLNKK